MKTHIDAVMGRYGDRLAHMDVVNERASIQFVSLRDRVAKLIVIQPLRTMRLSETAFSTTS